MMNPFCASVGFDAFIALRSIPSQVKMTPKTLTHFEGVSGRQIRNADCKHSNRASLYRNYTGPLLESFAPFIQNGLGPEPSQGCLARPATLHGHASGDQVRERTGARAGKSGGRTVESQ